MVGNRDVFLDRTKPGYFTFQLNHCGISACRAGYRYGFQLRPYHLIHFILRGSGTFETESQKTVLHSGHFIFLPEAAVLIRLRIQPHGHTAGLDFMQIPAVLFSASCLAKGRSSILQCL